MANSDCDPSVERLLLGWLQRGLATIAALTCLIMVIVTPPFQAADEYLHFYRAYQISTGQLVPTRRVGACSGYSRDFDDTLCLGGALPRSLLTTVRGASAEDLRVRPDRQQDFASLGRLWSIPLNSSDRHFLKFNTTGLHAPIGYLPQAIGIVLGRSVAAPPIALMYLGRLANGAVWIGLVAIAAAIVPELTLAWWAIGLLPMALFQAASLSADVLTNGLACVLVALVWHARSRPWTTAIAPWRLSALVAVFAVSKLAYAPMAAILLLIPARSFVQLCPRSRCGLYRWLWLVATGGLAIAAVAGWSHIVDRIYVSLHPDLDPTAQIAGILADPLGFVAIATLTLLENAGHYLHQLIGVFGWLDTPLPKLHVVAYAAALLAILRYGRLPSRQSLPSRSLRSWKPWRPWRLWVLGHDRAIAGLSLIGSVGLLCVLAYLWNAIGADRIGGIQGRYFIPLLPLLLVSVSASRSQEHWPWQAIAVGAMVLGSVSGASAIVTLVQRYYMGLPLG